AVAVEPAPGGRRVEDAVAVEWEGESIEVGRDLDDLGQDRPQQDDRRDRRSDGDHPLAVDRAFAGEGPHAGRVDIDLDRSRDARLLAGGSHGAAAAAAIPSVPR